ncbi:LysR family transcriptional regulator [Lentibacter sp. XHP0401]|uniref:LysR family transcriptional regulator n=1 Tax=Lentibacter sp. XHP0401 TaxID=2984334 RepID=UPI0021E9256A|nr:LysR family transcriptional regulator [Lentibacter sp. XHP0401]MCV2893818.1 LysR family transcriptional regulator [Lentibacter sp. XHP0401]
MTAWQNMPPLTALRAFAALAEAGSAQAAGALLNVSHAAVSQQIKALEAHMGLALVVRGGRRLELTEEGARLAGALELGFGAIEQVVGELTGRDARRALQISTTPSFAANWLLPRLPSFRANHKNIELMMNASPALASLEAGGIDLAIRHGEGDWQGVDAELILPTDIVVVAAPSLVQGGKTTDPTDLSTFHWLLEEGVHEASRWLRGHGVDNGRVEGVTYLSGSMTLEAARRGQGIVSMARLFVENDIAEGRLSLLYEEPERSMTGGYYLVTRKGAVLRPVAKAFAAWLRAEARLKKNLI